MDETAERQWRSSSHTVSFTVYTSQKSDRMSLPAPNKKKDDAEKTLSSNFQRADGNIGMRYPASAKHLVTMKSARLFEASTGALLINDTRDMANRRHLQRPKWWTHTMLMLIRAQHSHMYGMVCFLHL